MLQYSYFGNNNYVHEHLLSEMAKRPSFCHHRQQRTESDMKHMLLIAVASLYMCDLSVIYWLVTPEGWVPVPPSLPLILLSLISYIKI